MHQVAGRRGGISIDSNDLVRRVHSFEGGSHPTQSAEESATNVVDPSTKQPEILPLEQNEVVEYHSSIPASQKEANQPTGAFCCLPLKCHHDASFSENYHLPDSANLFWFKQPQLILRALRFVYFETAMAIALICFDSWQSSDFIIEHTNYFGNRFLLVIILISVGVLCLLQTSFLMLPTYALTMVAGSHCPETVLNAAKKMKISTEQVLRMERLGDKSIHTRMNELNKPLTDNTTDGNGGKGSHVDLHEQHISALVGAMYKGRLERLIRQTSEEADQNRSPTDIPRDAETSAAPLEEEEGQSSQDNSNGDEDMQGIVAVFGSFDGFLEQLQRAQVAIKTISPAACFNFNCHAGSYEGRESTSFDTAAIALALNLRMALLDDGQGSSS